MATDPLQSVVNILQVVGGQVVGRTRLQKTAYLLAATGLADEGFVFEYHHYGPYSEELTQAMKKAVLFGDIAETEEETNWGSKCSTYTLKVNGTSAERAHMLEAFNALTQAATSTELELAATALFLAREGQADPWAETAARKPQKAGDDRLEKAKALYQSLCELSTPATLPALPR
jgi:uncharacterized protein YwgA